MRQRQQRLQQREHVAAHVKLPSAATERLGIAETDASSDTDTGSVPPDMCGIINVTCDHCSSATKVLGCKWQGMHFRA